jgi:hypothetical protein
LLQAWVTSLPWVRSKLRLGAPPRAPPTTVVPTTASYQSPREAAPPAGLRERLSEQLKGAQKGLNNQIGNMTGRYVATEEDKAEQRRKESIARLEEKRRRQEREDFERRYKGRK